MAVADKTNGESPTKGKKSIRPTALERACVAARVADQNKGRDILVLDMRPVTTIYDFFVISTGTSRRQLHAIAEETDSAFTRLGDKRYSIEGYQVSKWILQDFGDIIVHVFDTDTRRYYELEELWSNAPRVDWAKIVLSTKILGAI